MTRKPVLPQPTKNLPTPMSAETGYRLLNIAALTEANTVISSTAKAYEQFTQQLAELRRVIDWICSPLDDDMPGVAFAGACRTLGQDPEKVAELLLTSIPKTLYGLAAENKNPFALDKPNSMV